MILQGIRDTPLSFSCRASWSSAAISNTTKSLAAEFDGDDGGSAIMPMFPNPASGFVVVAVAVVVVVVVVVVVLLAAAADAAG